MKFESLFIYLFNLIKLFFSFSYKLDFGIVLGCWIYIKEITNRSLLAKDDSIQEGDFITKVSGILLHIFIRYIIAEKEGEAFSFTSY